MGVAGAAIPEANAGAEPKMPGFAGGAVLGTLPSTVPDDAAALLPAMLAGFKVSIKPVPNAGMLPKLKLLVDAAARVRAAMAGAGAGSVQGSGAAATGSCI